MAAILTNPLVAVDANVLMDLGERVETVIDAFLAEAALLEARLLLSSDEHLRGINFTRLNLELHNFDLAAPVIVTPAEVARKFFSR